MRHLRLVDTAPARDDAGLPDDGSGEVRYVSARLYLAALGRCSCPACSQALTTHLPEPHDPRPAVSAGSTALAGASAWPSGLTQLDPTRSVTGR